MALQADGDGYDNRLSLDKDQFCEALSLILSKGSKREVSSQVFLFYLCTSQLTRDVRPELK